MSAIIPTIRYTALRRAHTSLPRRLPRRHLPVCRTITIQAPPSDSSASENGFELVSDASSDSSSSTSTSQHPFASVSLALPSPPEASPLPESHLMHPFDTHAFVTYLEKAELTSGTSRTLMEAVREIIVKRGGRTGKQMVGREDMENDAYLFKAALTELRTELSVRARNDGLTLRTMTGVIRREVEGLEQKLKEDIGTLKHDIEMDMNNRKSETRTEMKGFEIAIEEINNKFTISLGDLRTEIESVKWDATRRAISIIAVIVIISIGVSSFATSTAKAAAPKKAAASALPPPSQPTMRDMAVGDDETLNLDALLGEGELDKLLSESGVERLRRREEKVKVAKPPPAERI